MLSKFHKIFDAFTALERQIFQGAALVFAVSLILNGANAFYKKTILAPVEGGRYTEGAIGQPITVNPVIAGANDPDKDIIEITFSSFLELAKDLKPSADHKVWTANLKENLLWSDGQPLTGDDVVFTLETIQNPETRSPLFAVWDGVLAEKLNDSEIRFTLKSPYAFFADNLNDLKIIPKHIWDAIPAANLRLSDYNLEPIGSGPYAFAGYAKRKDGFINQYRLKINDYYFGDQPLLRDFRISFFPNAEEAIGAFNRKEIDGLGGLAAADLKNIKIGYQLHEINIPRYYAVFFNPSTTPSLKNKEVRQALALAANHSRMVSEILNGKGLVIDGPIYPGLDGYAGRGTAFDLERARELLDKNHWLIDGATGIRSKKIGKDILMLDFEIVVPQIEFLTAAAQALAADWQAIGVKLKPIILSPAEILNEIIKTRNYQMILFGNILKNNPDIFSFWHSSERFHPGLNLALYENKTVDAALESIRRNFDRESRNKDVKKIQAVIVDDQPAIFLFSPNYLYVGPKDLGGFNERLITSPANRFNAINKWYLKTARVFK